MVRRLHSMSSLAINNISMDTESDYDTDDIEATLNSSKLNLSDSMLGDSAGNLLPPKRPQLSELNLNHSGSWDDDEDDEEEREESGGENVTKRKVSRRKKRTVNRFPKDIVDYDKTPTADNSNPEDFAFTSRLEEEDSQKESSSAENSLDVTSDKHCQNTESTKDVSDICELQGPDNTATDIPPTCTPELNGSAESTTEMSPS